MQLAEYRQNGTRFFPCLNSEPVKRQTPMLNRRRPFFRSIPYRQIQYLEYSIIGRKCRAVALEKLAVDLTEYNARCQPRKGLEGCGNRRLPAATAQSAGAEAPQSPVSSTKRWKCARIT
jgi:hypothetical protein